MYIRGDFIPIQRYLNLPHCRTAGEISRWHVRRPYASYSALYMCSTPEDGGYSSEAAIMCIVQ